MIVTMFDKLTVGALFVMTDDFNSELALMRKESVDTAIQLEDSNRTSDVATFSPKGEPVEVRPSQPVIKIKTRKVRYRVSGKRDFSCTDPNGDQKPFMHEFEADDDDAARVHLETLRGPDEGWYKVKLIRIDAVEMSTIIVA